jgi:hypothetical protein
MRDDGIHYYRSVRGHPLIYSGPAPSDGAILTVENYLKWYGLELVMPDGSVEEIDYGILCDAAALLDVIPHVDHVPNPHVVVFAAERSRGWRVDRVSYEVMVGRWEALLHPRSYPYL